MFSKKYSLAFYLLFILFNQARGEKRFDDYKNHPCYRDCKTSKPTECKYEFELEWYSVLNRNCFNCTNNEDDCFKPHCISADGHIRAVKVINRMLPGPSIQVCEGDTIVVDLHNNLHSFEATTIHWHGLHQKGTPHMDGVGMITQCPITPHTRFQYRFTANDPGTHLWHAHSAGQRADGIFGAIVIRQAEDINSMYYDIDSNEHVIVLNDWMSQIMISKYTAFLHTYGDEQINGILINGRGVGLESHLASKLDYETPRSVFHVQKGKRYRFRIINSGVQFCPLQVSIDQHFLTVIATDGNAIQPIRVASFYILAGERVDFVLSADQPIGSYWIKVKGHADCEETEVFQTAVLKYDGSPHDLPTSEVNYETSEPLLSGVALNPFNTKINETNKNDFIGIDDLRSAADKNLINYTTIIASRVDKKFYLALDMNLVQNPAVYDEDTFALVESDEDPDPWTSPQINNISFHMPESPFFYQRNKISKDMICDQNNRDPACSNNPDEFCSCVHVLHVDLHDVVEVVIVDGGSQQENHPIHLHGQSFAVLGIDKLGESVLIDDVKEMDKLGKLKRNLKSPVLKDTVTVPSGGYTIFRFYAQNPGFWFMHCHVEFHSESGMALVFKVGDEKNLPAEPKNWPQCGNYAEVQNDESSNTTPTNVKNSSSFLKMNHLFLFAIFLFKILC